MKVYNDLPRQGPNLLKLRMIPSSMLVLDSGFVSCVLHDFLNMFYAKQISQLFIKNFSFIKI